MSKKNNDNITIIKKEVINPKSKQVNDNQGAVQTRPPAIAFNTLNSLYYNNFVVAGLTDKIATAVNSGFETSNEQLKKILNNIDHNFLNRNKINCGNAFFEVIRNGKDEVVELLPILSNTIEIMEDGDGYKQTIGTRTVFFNQFTKEENKKAKIEIYENSGAKSDELVNTGKGCGYNPILNEVYQFKNTSLSTKYYGSSFYEAVIDQITLLTQIDKYYMKGFDNGMIKSKFIYPKGEKNKLSKQDKEALSTFLKNKMKGVDNAFSTAILNLEVGQTDLEQEIDAKAFIEYRTQLIQAIAIALNVPYDMLLSDNSNRATSQTAKEIFNDYTIQPLQAQNIQDFKNIFGESYNVDDLEYVEIDTKDQKEEMEVWTGYKKAGIVTANEVRKKLGLPDIEGGDELKASTDNTNQSIQMTAKELIDKESKNFINKLTDIKDDTYSNL